eukprot:CAMPEP_0117757300 /NCGR_PEP_ID=MMETSP0947-20121206/14643_1 /TAXON_ID=44440 /ORGANISM="Chattonella subsalsa, Strain CCMP2191" /LENGTH=294 /DNA_ID=CAMNT_0005577155 /DNA_START=156 /DNA_END=1040 /DNA_ORIENTATION=+
MAERISIAAERISMIAEKQALRKEMRTKLRCLSNDLISKQSERIIEKLVGLKQFEEAKCVSVYLSMPKEVQTYPILPNLFEQCKRVCIPCITGKESGDMRMMPLADVNELNEFKLSKWNIPEPENDLVLSREDMTVSGELDLILMPGCAFDLHRNRLGHGKGYYDTFLEKVFKANEAKGNPRPALVALSLEEQVLENEEIPMNEHDVQMDMVITPTRIIQPDHTDSTKIDSSLNQNLQQSSFETDEIWSLSNHKLENEQSGDTDENVTSDSNETHSSKKQRISEDEGTIDEKVA